LPALRGYAALAVEAAAARGEDKDNRAVRQLAREVYDAEVAARVTEQLTSTAPFAERWAAFWSNHFAVSVLKAAPVLLTAGTFEREAIRPHVWGRFEELLLATARHPSMLVYLDNAGSIGPSSRAGRRRERGLNENYARELLELHTLGVDGGYTQADVLALAKVLTGWSVFRPEADPVDEGDRAEPGFRFFPNRHEPGDKTLLGMVVRESGVEEGEEALRALARHPSTARFLARKLLVAFGAPTPPPAAIDAVVRAWAGSGGDLAVVAAAVLDRPEVWRAEPTRLRTPVDLVIAGGRALGLADAAPLVRSMRLLAQPVWSPPSPAGWPDDDASWSGPDAILARVDWAEAVGRRARPRGGAAVALLDETLGPWASERTRRAVTEATSGAAALGLLFASPEFQRR
jgi:uncharacterized protein (DUF1800 family)